MRSTVPVRSRARAARLAPTPYMKARCYICGQDPPRDEEWSASRMCDPREGKDFDLGMLLIAMMLGVIPGLIANNKGYSFWSWWLFGALLFIVALPLAIMLKPDTGELVSRGEGRQCPFCAELIKPQAVVCRYCGRDLPDHHVRVASVRPVWWRS